MAAIDLKAKIITLMAQFEWSGQPTVTADVVAKSLYVSRSKALDALQQLIVERRVTYARKNPRSTQARFQLATGGRPR